MTAYFGLAESTLLKCVLILALAAVVAGSALIVAMLSAKVGEERSSQEISRWASILGPLGSVQVLFGLVFLFWIADLRMFMMIAACAALASGILSTVIELRGRRKSATRKKWINALLSVTGKGPIMRSLIFRQSTIRLQRPRRKLWRTLSSLRDFGDALSRFLSLAMVAGAYGCGICPPTATERVESPSHQYLVGVYVFVVTDLQPGGRLSVSTSPPVRSEVVFMDAEGESSRSGPLAYQAADFEQKNPPGVGTVVSW
jgi:hypothetical protein